MAGLIGRGPIANRPAFTFDGSLWIVTDGGSRRLTEYSDNQWFDVYEDPPYAPGSGGGGPGFPYTTPPHAASFTLDNQGPATLTDNWYGPTWFVPSGTLQGRFACISITPPKTLTVAARLGNFLGSTSFAGVAIRSGGLGGKYIGFGMFLGTSPIVTYYTSPVAYNSALYNPGASGEWYGSTDHWLRIVDDGTTLFFEESPDEGKNWLTIYSELRTAHLGVPDAYAVYIDSNNGSGVSSYIKSWLVS